MIDRVPSKYELWTWRVSTAVVFFGGVFLLMWAGGWRVMVGVFLMLWGNNMGNKFRFRR